MRLSDGVWIHTETVGEGPLLLALTGVGFDHQLMRPWLDGLSKLRTIAFIDPRGCGRSSPLPSGPFAWRTWVRDLDEIGTRLGSGRFDLLGHSSAGLLAQVYAIDHPDRLGRLVLCGTMPSMAHAPQSIERFTARQTAQNTEILRKLFSQPIASDREFKEAMLAILPAYFGERLVPEVMETMARHTIFRAAAMEVFRNAMAPTLDTTPDLRHIRVPTLVLSGRHDFIAPAA